MSWRSYSESEALSPQELAEKFTDTGWRGLTPTQQQRIEKAPQEMIPFLESRKAKALLLFLDREELTNLINPPSSRLSLSVGKAALIKKVRAKTRAKRRQEAQSLNKRFPEL